MKLMTMAAMLVVSGLAWAQDPAPAPPQEGEGRGRGPRRIEVPQDPARQAEQRARFLKERLDLTDEQVQKAVEIYKQAHEAEQKVESDRQAKLREILTDDQKKKYEELIQNPGGRGTMAMGGSDRMLENWAERLKKDLALSDEAFEKIKAIVEEFRKKTGERIAEMRQGGLQGMNWQEEWKKFQDGLKESGDKIKEHLTPEQKEKFDKLLEQFQPGRGFDQRGPSPEERAGRIVESLKIEKSDEQAAVKSALLKVFETQRALGEFDRDSRAKIEELHKDTSLSDEQLLAKITEFRTARLEKDKALKAAQKDLRDLVSPRQELELIRQLVLR